MPTLTWLTRRPTASTVVIAVVGCSGSVLVAWASYVVGTLPQHHLDKAAATGPWRWPYEVGLVLVVVAWLALGRLVLDPAVAGMDRRIWWAGAAIALPLLLAAPVTSQDVWAYLGQADVAAHGLDPYSVGPAAVPGPFGHAVAHEWVGARSPYGPLWLWVSRLVVELTRPHPWAGMFVLRGLGVVCIVAIGAALVRLCRATRGRPEVALWLAVVGPLPLLMLVGAVHNEALMLALMLGGVAISATEPRMWRALALGAVLVGAAGAVKVVALVALPFLPLIWMRYADPARSASSASSATSPTYRRWISTGSLVLALGVATVLALGVVTGFGSGWVHAVGDGGVGGRWLSLPQQVGSVLHVLDPGQVADQPVDRFAQVHAIGLIFLVVSLAAVTLTALRRPPLQTLALALLLVVVSSPAPRTWYLLWPLMFVAVTVSAGRAPRGLLVGVAAGSAALALWIPPAVRPPLPEWVLLALLIPLGAATLWIARSAASVPDGMAEEPDSVFQV